MKRIHILLIGLLIAFGVSLHAVQSTINVGSSANDGTGDTLRSAMQKVNSNFTELYGTIFSFNGNQFGTSSSTNVYIKSGATLTNSVIYGSTSGTNTFTAAGNLLVGTTSETGLTGAGGIRVASTTASTTSATGSAVFGGGVGIGGAAYLGGAVVAAGKITGGSSSLNGNGVVTSYFDSATDDAFAAQNSNATYARVWKFGPNTGTARAFNFRDSTGGATVLILYDGGAATPYRVYVPASLQVDGDVVLAKTITAGGTTGAQTINKSSGSVNFAAAATSLVVTCSLCTTSSIITATVGSNDSTMKSVAVVAGSGSFTLYANAAPTAETRVNFRITN